MGCNRATSGCAYNKNEPQSLHGDCCEVDRLYPENSHSSGCGCVNERAGNIPKNLSSLKEPTQYELQSLPKTASSESATATETTSDPQLIALPFEMTDKADPRNKDQSQISAEQKLLKTAVETTPMMFPPEASTKIEITSQESKCNVIELSSQLEKGGIPNADAPCLPIDLFTTRDLVAEMKGKVSADKEKPKMEATTKAPTAFSPVFFDIPEEITIVKRCALSPIPTVAVTDSIGGKANTAVHMLFSQKPTYVREQAAQAETIQNERRISPKKDSVQVQHQTDASNDSHKPVVGKTRKVSLMQTNEPTAHKGNEKALVKSSTAQKEKVRQEERKSALSSKKRPLKASGTEPQSKKAIVDPSRPSTPTHQPPSRVLSPAFDRLLTSSGLSFKSMQHIDIPDRLYRLQYAPFIETRYPSRSNSTR